MGWKPQITSRNYKVYKDLSWVLCAGEDSSILFFSFFFTPAFYIHSYTLCIWHPRTQTHSQSNCMWAQNWEAANTLKQKGSTWKFSTCAAAPLLLALSSDNALFKGCLRHLSDITKQCREQHKAHPQKQFSTSASSAWWIWWSLQQLPCRTAPHESLNWLYFVSAKRSQRSQSPADKTRGMWSLKTGTENKQKKQNMFCKAEYCYAGQMSFP